MKFKRNFKQNKILRRSAKEFFTLLKIGVRIIPITLKNYFLAGTAENNMLDYIEIFYNNQRMPSYLGYLSPNAFEMQFGSRK